jgi:hypothetical protein
LTITSANSITKTGSSVGASKATTIESYPYNSTFLIFCCFIYKWYIIYVWV